MAIDHKVSSFTVVRPCDNSFAFTGFFCVEDSTASLEIFKYLESLPIEVVGLFSEEL